MLKKRPKKKKNIKENIIVVCSVCAILVSIAHYINVNNTPSTYAQAYKTTTEKVVTKDAGVVRVAVDKDMFDEETEVVETEAEETNEAEVSETAAVEENAEDTAEQTATASAASAPVPTSAPASSGTSSTNRQATVSRQVSSSSSTGTASSGRASQAVTQTTPVPTSAPVQTAAPTPAPAETPAASAPTAAPVVTPVITVEDPQVSAEVGENGAVEIVVKYDPNSTLDEDTINELIDKYIAEHKEELAKLVNKEQAGEEPSDVNEASDITDPSDTDEPSDVDTATEPQATTTPVKSAEARTISSSGVISAKPCIGGSIGKRNEGILTVSSIGTSIDNIISLEWSVEPLKGTVTLADSKDMFTKQIYVEDGAAARITVTATYIDGSTATSDVRLIKHYRYHE